MGVDMVTDISSYNFVMHQSIPSISSFILFINVTILVNNLRYLSTKKVVPIEICVRDLNYSYCFIDLVSEREHKKFCLSIYFRECANYCYNMHMHIVTFIYMYTCNSLFNIIECVFPISTMYFALLPKYLLQTKPDMVKKDEDRKDRGIKQNVIQITNGLKRTTVVYYY